MPHENPLNSVTCLKMYVYLARVKQNSYPSRTNQGKFTHML